MNEPELMPSVEEAPQVLSALPDDYHETMRLKLQGLATKEIAARMGIDRTTVYRRCKAVEEEFLAVLEGRPKLNIIADSLQRLELIYQKAMDEHETTSSARVRDASLNTARKAAKDIMGIYLDTGIIERAPERHYSTVLSVKPSDVKAPEEIRLTREQAEAELIEAMQRSRLL